MDNTQKIIKNIEDLCIVKNQRSPEWFSYKGCRIGGSEISNICKLSSKNVNTFINNFLYNKIDRKRFFISACTWGILFEDEIQKYCEVKYNTKIYNFGVLQSQEVRGMCYSPDGVAIIDGSAVLFEFKCPYSRIPLPNIIKYDYLCQINAGLNIIKSCNTAYFCEGEFKVCKLKDLFNKNIFNTNVNNAEINRNFIDLYVSYGIIYIYKKIKNNKPNNKENQEKNVYDKYKNNITDFGELLKYEFVNNLLYKIYSNEYEVVYFNDLIKNNYITSDILNNYDNILPYNNNKELINQELLNIIQKAFNKYIKDKNGELIGYIPYKLYNYNMVIQKKNKEFLDGNLKSKISYIHYLLKYSTTIEKLEDKKEYLKSSIYKLNLDNINL
mgnify:CR=1 FL=1|tara:strand:+ start:367 stop:1518 length:1152 start_codon:yes stop_codon:yes gene_type:complete